MRRVALGVLLVALALPLAACGGSSSVSADMRSVAQAATKTEDAGSARFELSVDAKGLPGQSAGAGFTAQGAVDYESQRSTMTVDLGSLAGLFGQAGESAEDTSIEMLVDGKVVYMKFPLLSGLIGQGKPWLMMDVEKLAAETGQDLGELAQVNRGDPTQALAYLKAAGDFEAVGSEQVRGVATTHHKGAIDIRKALDQVSGDQKAQLEKLLNESGVTELPAEAWIDGDGYLRKMTLAFAGLTGASEVGFDVAMELFDFGAEVDVQLPPDDEVTDISELLTKGELTP